MKKSSFLHKPKDLLSKSFNPAKCKTALKLATSRIKLLKNKKENQVNQMKRELAQLLESGQDRNARIRVEHVIREEKMMAAYELIEIYCELIVARITIIETQKSCPIDLKEAVTSVVFASPRCGDIPELLDIRKQFTGKYGKEFTSAAIELRPDCGVSRMLVEKLSARAPDTPVKVKTLTAIAEQHNIKWDPMSFEENEALPPNDLLNGPSTFKKRSEDARFSTPHVQASSPHTPTVLNPPSNFSETNIKSSQGSESNNRSSNSVPSEETGQSNHQEGSGYSFGRQNWNMNFKDAASAAQAAAESAEHASMAARAAAELSSFGKSGKQFSPDSVKDSRVENDLKGRRFSGESQKFHEQSRINDDHHHHHHHSPRDSANSSFVEQPPEVQNAHRENVGSNNTHRASEKSNASNVGIEKIYHQTSSLTSRASLDKDPPPLSGLPKEERYSENSLFKGEELGPEMTSMKETYKDEPVRVNFHEEGFNYYGHEVFEEDENTKQSSPHSISGFDDNFVNSGPARLGSDFSDHHSVNISQELFDKRAESSSHNDGGVVSFDDYGSDDEEFGFPNSSHLNINDEPTLFHPSGRTSPSRFSADTGGSGTVGFQASKMHEESESLFSNKPNLFAEISETSGVAPDRSEQEKIGPVMFDDSDGPSSDNETDMDHQPWAQNHNLSSASPSFHESHTTDNQRNETGDQYKKDFGLSMANADHSSPGIGKSTKDSGSIGEADTTSSSSIMTQFDDEDSHHGLNLGKLTGGLRHKGPARFPYPSRRSDDFSTSSTVMAEPATTTKKSEIPENARPFRFSSSHLDSDSETSEDVYEKTRTRKSGVKQNVRSPVRFFGSESSDSEDDSAKQAVTGKRSTFGSGVSRRTQTNTSGISSRRAKANTPVETGSFSSKFKASSTSSFSGTETPPSDSHVRRSSPVRNAYNNMNMESNVKPSVAQSSTSEPSSSGKVISREDSGKKASHVHPKLPDYDTIASRLQALRTNRQ